VLVLYAWLLYFTAWSDKVINKELIFSQKKNSLLEISNPRGFCKQPKISTRISMQRSFLLSTFGSQNPALCKNHRLSGTEHSELAARCSLQYCTAQHITAWSVIIIKKEGVQSRAQNNPSSSQLFLKQSSYCLLWPHVFFRYFAHQYHSWSGLLLHFPIFLSSFCIFRLPE